MRLTEHSFINRNQNHPSHAMRLQRSVAFIASVLLSVLVGTPCSGDDYSTPARGKGKGRVTIIYQDDAIQPENRDAIKKIRDSGVFERMADRLTKTVALPHDLQIVVTDKTPKGFDDPTTEVDGRRIWWPAAFSFERPKGTKPEAWRRCRFERMRSGPPQSKPKRRQTTPRSRTNSSSHFFPQIPVSSPKRTAGKFSSFAVRN